MFLLDSRPMPLNNNNRNSQNYQHASGSDSNDNVQQRQHPSKSNSNHQQSSTGTASRPTSSSDLFSKWSAVMKTKSAEVKGKLLDYIVNPNAPNGAGGANASTSGGAHLGARMAAGQPSASGDPYRHMGSVFSIDEDQEDSVVSDLPPSRMTANSSSGSTATDYRGGAGGSSFADQREIVQLSSFLKSPDVIKAYKCQEVHLNGHTYDSHLIVTGTHLVVVRDLGRRGEAQAIVRRPLSSIVKITAKKRQRDLITFKYGMTNGDTLVVSDMDRFLIPNASAATELVSQQIIRQLEAAESNAAAAAAAEMDSMERRQQVDDEDTSKDA